MQTTSQLTEKQENGRSIKSNLKKVLSKEIKTSEEDTIFGDDQNHFILEENNERRLIMRMIVDNINLNEPEIPSKLPKKLKFSQTKVHEVENWKKYNRPEPWFFGCCFHCL